MTRHLPILLAALALSAPAAAQPAPPTQPLRDVVVTYRVDGEATSQIPGGLPGPVRLSWDAAGQRLRAEAEGRNQVALVDLRNHTGQAFDTALRIVLPLKMKPNELQPLTLEGARLVPRGHDTVAGLACTVYTVETGRGPGTVCLTPDGVPLRGEGDVNGKPGAFVATAVQYGRLPPDLFEPPRGYMALGGGPGGGLGGKLGSLGINPNDLRNLLGRGPK